MAEEQKNIAENKEQTPPVQNTEKQVQKPKKVGFLDGIMGQIFKVFTPPKKTTPTPPKDQTPMQTGEKKPVLDESIQKPEKKKSLFSAIIETLNLDLLFKSKAEKDAAKKAHDQEMKATQEELKKKQENKKAGLAGVIENEETTTKEEKEKKEKEEEKKKPKKEKLTKEEREAIQKAAQQFMMGVTSINNIIAPDSMQVNFDKLKISGRYAKTFFVYNYPRFIESNWLSPIINFDATFDISMFVYPMDSSKIARFLRNKVAQISASMHIKEEKGYVRDPALEAALQDAEEIRDSLQRGTEKFFHYGLYFTIYADDEKKLTQLTKQFQSLLGGRLVLTKPANLQMEHAFNSTLPLGSDEMGIFRNMNTSPLSSTFPFTSSDLTTNEGILYGVNRHNDSLIIFDRFKLENANSVIFAKSGAGKSFAVKLEILRSLMLGTDVIVIDPENEYQALCNTVGGTYLNVSLNAQERINPFDLPSPFEGQIVLPGDMLRSNTVALTGLMHLMLGKLDATEEALMDNAILKTYELKGITMSTENPHEKEVPTMTDLYNVLLNIKGAEHLAERLQKFTTGTYAGLFNQKTNIDLDKGMVVFCIRDLEDQLRPIAMYIILNYIWSKVRSELRRRILVIDEAWTMMQYEDSAKFMYGLVKRARKYYLGVSTITQDVEDFLKSKYGKPVITNSSMQLLLRQSPAAIDTLVQTFNLTEGEKYMLLNSGVGQGLFFAGNKHVAIQIIASYTEKEIITTNPEELIAKKEEEQQK